MAIETEKLTYSVDGVALESTLYHSGEPGQRALVMFPNAMGPNAANLEQGQDYAALGYAVLVSDLYGADVRPTTVDGARAASKALREAPGAWHARAVAALEALRAHPMIDESRVGAIGFCSGGSTALELARAGIDLPGVACLHGGLKTDNPAQADTLKASIIVLHGADDPVVATEEVHAFEDEMRAAGGDWQLTLFGGAVHSFADREAVGDLLIPGKIAFHPTATRRSQKMVVDFFTEIFG